MRPYRPVLPSVAKAHGRDPRFLQQPAYSPEYQADQAQFHNLDEAFRRMGFASYEDAYRTLRLKNVPPAVRQIPFYVQIVNIGDQHILIPQNLRRMGFTVFNPQTAAGVAYWTYGPFPAIKSAGGFPLSLSLAVAEDFQESNGTVSIDDIYVTGDTAGMWVGGFEATLAIESEQNR